MVGSRFLLAQLHMDSLRDKTSIKSVKKALETLPEGAKGLDLAYDEALKRVDSQRDGFRLLAKRLLGWVTYSERLMTVTEVQYALAIEPDTLFLDEENLSDVDEIVGFCAGLVIVDEETQIIRLAHYTTQEYLTRNGDRILPSAQQDIAVSCLTYLLYDQLGDGWVVEVDCKKSGQTIGPIASIAGTIEAYGPRCVEKRSQRHPFLNYAARYWAIHAGVCGQRNIKELMMRFAKDDFRVSTASQMILILDRRYKILEDVDDTMARSPLSAVHLTAYLGDAHTMSELLNQGFEVNALDANHRGPLWWAALQGHDAVVGLLLSQKNVNVNSRGLFHNRADGDQRYTETPLGAAAYMGKTRIVELLIEREDVDVNLPGKRGDSPLISAVRQGHSATVGLLLTREDVDVNSRNLAGETPLWCAADYGQKDTVRQLLNIKNTQVNCVDNLGRSPLSTAASSGHKAAVKLLLYHADIDVNAKDYIGETALTKAAKQGYVSVVKILSAYPDVDLNPTDNIGRDVFALVSEAQRMYTEHPEWYSYGQRMKESEECLRLLRAAIEKRSPERRAMVRTSGLEAWISHSWSA